MTNRPVTLTLSYDEAFVLFEFFARFRETDRLELAHVAEFLALARVSAQIDSSVTEMFDPNYAELLATARARLAGDTDGDYPGPKVQGADA